MLKIRDLNRKILGPYRLSHHPLCDDFHEHVYLIRSKKICRGCLMQYSGMISSFIIIILGNLPIFKWWDGLSEYSVGFMLYLLIIPTILTAFLIHNRKVKDLARFLLGVSFTLAFVLLIFTPDWIIKGWIILNLVPGYMYLNRRRSVRNREICETCEEYTQMPYCRGFQIYADRETIFLKQAAQGGIHDPFALSPDQLDDLM